MTDPYHHDHDEVVVERDGSAMGVILGIIILLVIVAQSDRARGQSTSRNAAQRRPKPGCTQQCGEPVAVVLSAHLEITDDRSGGMPARAIETDRHPPPVGLDPLTQCGTVAVSLEVWL